MPTRATLDAFIRMVVENRHVEASETFYRDDAVTQENEQLPIHGKAAIAAKEVKAIARVREIVTHKPVAVVHEGDRAAIHWIFDIVDQAGARRRLKEIAFQIWSGELIVSEQFFYDSSTAWQTVEGADPVAGRRG